MAPHKNKNKTFFFHIPHFSSILNNLCYFLPCPSLRTAPSTGEAAKLTNGVTEITSYCLRMIQENVPKYSVLNLFGL
jgi:hypothetical protein